MKEYRDKDGNMIQAFYSRSLKSWLVSYFNNTQKWWVVNDRVFNPSDGMNHEVFKVLPTSDLRQFVKSKEFKLIN